jgi:hypothetical protein
VSSVVDNRESEISRGAVNAGLLIFIGVLLARIPGSQGLGIESLLARPVQLSGPLLVAPPVADEVALAVESDY